MNRDLSVRLLFIVLVAVAVWLAVKILAPFAAGFTWAAVLVVTFRPMHQRLTSFFKGRRWIASTLVTILVAAFVVVPLVAAGVQVIQGGTAAYEWVSENYQTGGSDLGLGDRWPWIADGMERAKELVGLAGVDLKVTALTGLKRLGGVLAAKGPALVGGAIGFAFSFIIMLIGMPVFFVHGEAFARAIAEAMPVPEPDALRILEDLRVMTRTVFLSVGITAAVQAALGGIALFVLGVPYALPLTAAMFFMSVLPGGTGLVWVPCAIWLAATGHAGKATLLAVWGAGVVSTIDNFLRPLIAGKGVKLPIVMLFLGMFGGLIAFGLVGLFLGPITLYMTRELVAILKRDLYAPPVSPAGPGFTSS